jgi:hypothetical protein
MGSKNFLLRLKTFFRNVTLRPSMNAPRTSRTDQAAEASAPEEACGLNLSDGEPWRWCPRCSHELHNEKCKLRCPRCHYFMSCSDFD